MTLIKIRYTIINKTPRGFLTIRLSLEVETRENVIVFIYKCIIKNLLVHSFGPVLVE